MKTEEYFKKLEKDVKNIYEIAEKARKKGLDPVDKIEVPIATSLAGRVSGLIGAVYPQLKNEKLVNRILELEKEHGSLDPAVCLKIAEEIAKEKFCKFRDLKEGIDAGIRVGMAYITLGVVSSPIEGFTELKIRKTKEGKEYFDLYFSGPIRSAGGTGAAFSLVIADHLREILGYSKFDPSEKEVKRYVTEMFDYHERVTNLQYLPTEEEAIFLAQNLPVQVDGDPTEKREVSNYKDLPRIETNFIRGGFCLVFAEGMAQKAAKIWRMIKKLRDKGFKLTDWDFLEEFMKIHEKREKGKAGSSGPTFIKDLVAGRPVLGHPSAHGAFRLRYGRARNTGFSSLAIHPATMYILGEFAAIGTQVKIELPTKGAALNSCDTIEGPIVKLNNGSVRKINHPEIARDIYDDVSEIIYLGDLLIPYGDFANRNHILMPAGYVEQEWYQEVKKKNDEQEDILEINNIYDVDLTTAKEIGKKFDIPLHPKYIFFWKEIDKEQFFGLLDWIARAKIIDNKILLPYSQNDQERFTKGKRALEILGIPHEVITENVILDVENSQAFLENLGIKSKNLESEIDKIVKKIKDNQSEDVLELVNTVSNLKIRDKSGTFIGSRMGRPEKAKLRKLAGSPNMLFPVGDEGGRLRSVIEACKIGDVRGDFPLYFCDKCKKENIFKKCTVCGSECKKEYYCKECRTKISSDKCAIHNANCQEHAIRKINIKQYFDNAVKQIGLDPSEIPALIKGVRGTSNKNHVAEHMAKGIIRAMFNLQVNKDGTIRFDATELPITHFKPKEISTSVPKLKELGYEKDIYGKELENEEQILGLFPHDIILPACPASADEKADEVFIRIANFIDTLLIKLYGLKPFYNVKTKEDLIGQLGACIAPHNCACVCSRIIGFSKTQGLFASPYMHAAMRRDCDGDEAGFMLLLDMLLNFSMEFLPAHRGGTQDAPLVMNVRIRAGEVDDMIFDFDVQRELPLELYDAANRKEHPSKIKIEQIKDRVGKKEFDDLMYEYETSDINQGVLCSSYKRLVTMMDKVRKQMDVAEKIRAVITPDVARLVIDRHFIRDIRGNLRKFSQQEFRCGKCNEKYRRPPLVGKCLKCGGKVIFTISEGSIIKYMEPALELATKYDIPAYMKQSLELTKSFIESIFGKDKERQADLQQWF